LRIEERLDEATKAKYQAHQVTKKQKNSAKMEKSADKERTKKIQSFLCRNLISRLF
jgi:FKBP-type peptidyl-prolyl cis-trans isomerase